MISDLPTFSALKERMLFLQGRQKLLAQNVANADLPGYKPKDMVQAGLQTPNANAAGFQAGSFAQSVVRVATTDPQHIGSADGMGGQEGRASRVETRPSGNAVNLEDEMLKVSQNQIDFQTAANLYQRSLGTLKLALGRKA